MSTNPQVYCTACPTIAEAIFTKLRNSNTFWMRSLSLHICCHYKNAGHCHLLYALSVWSHPHFNSISTHSKSDLSKNTDLVTNPRLSYGSNHMARSGSRFLLQHGSHHPFPFCALLPRWPSWKDSEGTILFSLALTTFSRALVPSTWNSFPFPVPSSTLANLLLVLQVSV